MVIAISITVRASGLDAYDAVTAKLRDIREAQAMGQTRTRAGYVAGKRVQVRTDEDFAGDAMLTARRALTIEERVIYGYIRAGFKPSLIAMKRLITPDEAARRVAGVKAKLGAAWREAGLFPVSRYFGHGGKVVAMRQPEKKERGPVRPPVFGGEAA